MMCLLAIATTWAAPVNENQARNIAASFMANHSMRSTSLRMAHKAPMVKTAGADNAAYYVFNATSGGFVIVAGDDRAPEVLGYSDTGTFDIETVPEAMQEMLEGYEAQINALALGAKPASRSTSGPAIRPLVTASWSQNAPYNTMLPMLNNGQQAVAGCVATAMAQVLYYWKQPTISTAIPEYTSQSLGIYMHELPAAEFNWEAMQDVYLSSDTQSEGALAAAQLTLYCAQSVKMNFLYGTSGANTGHIPNAISTYFGYKRSAHCEYRENYSTQGWNNLVYSELAEGRPVIYSGSKASGGHAFICDGYDGEGMFHINWGWDGMSNGYYLLNVLNPDAQGTGSASEAYGYIYSQYIVAGIEPGEGNSEFALTAVDVALNSAVTSRVSNNANFSANVNGKFFNYTAETMSVSFGWGLYQDDELISVLYNSAISSLPPNYYMSTNNQELYFGKGITSGTYRIVPMYSELYANNWRPCKGAEVNYIEVTIDGDECTVIGQGTAGARDYVVNSITCNGSLHHGRPVDLAVNMTNNGYSQNDLLYIQDGSDPIAITTITVDEMPAANLSITPEVLNVTDAQNRIVTSDKFSLKLNITNNGATAYNDDITVKLYRRSNGNSGSNVQVMNQLVNVPAGQSTMVQFDMDNVMDGWEYFAAIYYYSAGQMVRSTITQFYTIVFPAEPQFTEGDVNNDSAVNIADVTSLIDYLLGSGNAVNELAADVNGDHSINIADVTALIDMLLSN